MCSFILLRRIKVGKTQPITVQIKASLIIDLPTLRPLGIPNRPVLVFSNFCRLNSNSTVSTKKRIRVNTKIYRTRF